MKTETLFAVRRPAHRNLVAGAVLAALLAAPAVYPALAQTRLAQVSIEEALAGGVTIQGRVTDIFDDRVLIEDTTGRILVETAGAADKPPTFEVGQIVKIDGRLRGRVIEARRIVLASGDTTPPATSAGSPPQASAVPVPPAPQATIPPADATGRPDPLVQMLMRPVDPATLRASLEGAGLTPAGSPVRHDKHTEIPARDARGRAWVVSLDRFGRIEESEIADYDDDAVPSRATFGVSDIPAIVEREGFRARAQAERRPEHFEVIATTRNGEMVELHIDFAGQIYKQVWIR